MTILRIKTPFAEYKLGDRITDENSKAFWEQYEKAFTEGYEGNVYTCTQHSEEFPLLDELRNKLKFVSEIKFYPEENKFEIFADGDIVSTIVSSEYFIENKKASAS